MRSKIFSPIVKAHYRKIAWCLYFLTIMAGSNAHDGKGVAIPVKTNTPLNFYYQWMMLGVAICYTIFLVVRARKRNVRNKRTQF